MARYSFKPRRPTARLTHYFFKRSVKSTANLSVVILLSSDGYQMRTEVPALTPNSVTFHL